MANDTVLQQALRPFESVPGVKTGKNLIEVEEAVAGPDRQKYESALETESKRAAEMKTKQAQMEAEKQKGITSALEAEKTGLETDKDVAEARRLSEGRQAFVPTQQTAGDLGTIFAITNILGFAIGRGGKGPAQAALSAQNGMLEGYQKGNADLYKKQKEIFETNQKELDRKLNDLLKFAEQNAKVRAVNKELGEQQANQKYAEEGASFIAELEKKYGPEKSIEFLKSLKEKADQKAKIITKEIDEERKFNQQKQLKQMEITAAKLKENNKTAIPMLQGIRGIERLQEQLRDPEIQTGLLAKTAPWMEKLKSISDSSPDADFESVVNQKLTGNDKTTLFLKDALLESYAIERAANGGARVTVQMMKQAGPVLDPTNYTPQTYNQLLDTRRKVLYDNLQDMGYSPEQIKKSSAAHEYTPYGGESKPALKEIKTQAEYDALPSGSEYLEDGKKYRKP
jgi:hypothetical protein